MTLTLGVGGLVLCATLLHTTHVGIAILSQNEFGLLLNVIRSRHEIPSITASDHMFESKA